MIYLFLSPLVIPGFLSLSLYADAFGVTITEPHSLNQRFDSVDNKWQIERIKYNFHVARLPSTNTQRYEFKVALDLKLFTFIISVLISLSSKAPWWELSKISLYWRFIGRPSFIFETKFSEPKIGRCFRFHNHSPRWHNKKRIEALGICHTGTGYVLY